MAPVLVRVRNNSSKLITLPAVGTPNDDVKGPQDSIRLPPGTVTPVDSARLMLYDSPAFRAKFEEGKNGERPQLEALPPSTPVRSLADNLKQYEEQNAGREATAPEVKVSGSGGRTNAKGEQVNTEPGTSGALPSTPVGNVLDAAGAQ